MKHSAKVHSDHAQSASNGGAKAKPPRRKRAPKQARTSKELTGSRADVSGIRETEEARALLEEQLHRLYWWVFNACKMKGFIRAKGRMACNEPEVVSNESQIDQHGFAEDHVSPGK